MTRRKLTVEEQAAVTRLQQIWNRKRVELKLTQEQVAHRCGWANQSAFYQYLSGRVPLNLIALLKIATVLQVAPQEIRPELLKQVYLAVGEEGMPYNVNRGLGVISREEEAILQKYRQLKSRERTQIQAVVDAITSTMTAKKKTGN